MSYLAVTAFTADLPIIEADQRIEESVAITTIRARMIKHGTISDGTLTLDILDGATVIGTGSVTASEFESVGATYAYGYFNFELDGPTVINIQDTPYKEITYRFTMSGHTYDANNWVGLIRQFDRPYVGEFGARPASVSPEDDGWFNSYGIEVYRASR